GGIQTFRSGRPSRLASQSPWDRRPSRPGRAWDPTTFKLSLCQRSKRQEKNISSITKMALFGPGVALSKEFPLGIGNGSERMEQGFVLAILKLESKSGSGLRTTRPGKSIK